MKISSLVIATFLLVLTTNLNSNKSWSGSPLSVPNPSSPHRWPTFRNGPQNTGTHPFRAKTWMRGPSSRKPSSFKLGGLIWATPVIDESDNVYIGSSNKSFYSFSPTGELRWRYEIFPRADSLIDSAAAILPDAPFLVVPGGDGFLHFISRDSGERVALFQARGATDESHQKGTVVNSFEGNVQAGPSGMGLVFAGSDNGEMYAVDQNGKQVWSIKTQMMIWSSPAFGPDHKWMAFGSLDHKLYIVEPTRGQVLATFDSGADIKSSPTIDSDGNIYFGTSDGKFFSVRLENSAGTGPFSVKQNWAFQGDGEIYSSPALKNNKLVFSTLNGFVYAITTGGKEIWKYSTHSRISSSALITQDQVVLFGAKNGKLYAVDLETGERIWSYRTTQDPIKINLDSSPAMDSSGFIYVGSYSGTLYKIPFEYCMTHVSNTLSCEFGGKDDLPDYDLKRDQNISTLRFIPAQSGPRLFEAGEMLQTRLVVMKDREFIDQAAIDASPSNLTVKITPGIDLDTQVSSDGKYLNFIPKTFFKPDTTYTLEVKGLYFKHSKSWFEDRTKYFGRKSFEAKLTFKTKPSTAEPFLDAASADQPLVLGLKSLYLHQPEALDTYIPAALDGQGFRVSTFALDPSKKKMLMLALPAIYRQSRGSGDETFQLLAEPSKVFALDGMYQGDQIRGAGSFSISAMGGEMPFTPFIFTGTFNPEENSLKGQFNTTTSCLKIKGNGSSYNFPMSLLNQVCDPWMRALGMGSFEGSRIVERPVSVNVTQYHQPSSSEIELSLQFPNAVSGDHLITLVQYDPRKLSVVHVNSQVLNLSSSMKGKVHNIAFKLKEKFFSCGRAEPSYPYVIFFDSQMLNLENQDTCSSP